MEMKLLDSFGPIDNNFPILLDDEYAYSSGARIVIRPLITNADKTNKYLEAKQGHFSKFIFNPKTNQFITCEVSFNTLLTIKVYLYTKSLGFTLQTETKIENCTEVTDLDITRDGSRLCVLLPEPHLCLKIYELTTEAHDEGNEEEEEEEEQIKEEKGLILKEILSVPLIVNSYSKCKFNPLKKNFIFMLSQKVGTLVEILDSFPEGYQSMEANEEIPLENIKSKEEKQLMKRFEVYHLDAQQTSDDYLDFCWARYNHIYLSYSSGEVYLYDLIKRMQNIREKKEPIEDKDPDRIEDLSNTVHAMLLTQRYLVCAEENGKVALVNMYLSEADFKECRSSLGGADMYRMFHVDNELEVTKMVQTGEYITSMKYNNDYQKILAKTNFNNLYCLVLKGEILITNQEAQTDSENTSKEIYNFEELKFHAGKLFGIKALGETSEAISISEEDKRIIFWDIGKKQATTSTVVEFAPTCFETNPDGNLLFIASQGGVFRIFDITRRASINLIYQMKFNYKTSDFINRILIHPLMKFIVFYKKGDRYIYFISGEIAKKFSFLGYIKVPTAIIDININNVQGEDFSTDPITLGSIVVLVRGMLLLYNVNQFFADHKECWDIRKDKVDDVFSRFELKVEPKARKVDGDLNLMLKNCSTKPQTHIWLCGTDKVFRIFPLPVDKIEVVKESKKPIETPEEIKAHDLELVCGNVYEENVVITAGKDGFLQYRKDKKLLKQFRSHSFTNGGISNFFYNQNKRLLYVSGYDGSISLIGLEDDVELPGSEVLPELLSPMDSMESVDLLSDELCKNFVEHVNEQHHAQIKALKRQNQTELISKLDEIKNDQAKLFLDNSKLETHEQLKEEEMIIDKDTIKNEEAKNIEASNELTKKRFKEVCEMELVRTVLLDNTYNIMKENNDEAILNNNLRLAFNSSGTRELKSYPLPNFTERTKNFINYTKQLRLTQKMEEYKNRNEGISEVLPEKALSVSPEDYIVNRISSMPIIIEKEVILIKNGQEEGISKEIILDDKNLGNVAKYRLQRNPYEEVNKKGEGDGGDMGIKGPDEQIYKEDRQLEYRTMLEINKNIPDVEFKSNLDQISSFSLIYSPFELYTNNRIRSQIYLLIDVIHQMKKNFNADFAVYITERNQVLEKFNTNKSAIEAIREILTDIPIPEYSYAFNKHEDNEWIEKFDPKEVKVPKYFSKEEKKKLEEEQKAEEERLKALQGDTLQMRGLHHMIDNKVKSNKKNQNEETELVREPWMNKKKEEMTEEQLKIFLEFQKKEMEIREQKEKIRSQNLTKLNFHKSEIENNLMDLDMKFAKILRRKLHYDTLIAEEEVYILSLIKLLQKRQEVEKTKRKIELEKKASEEQEAKLSHKRNEFKNCLNVKETAQAQQEEEKKNPREDDKKNNYKDEIKNLFTILDPKRNEAYLKSIRSDPFYFDERERLEHLGKYGEREYDEIPSELIKQFNQNQRQSQQQRNTQMQQEKALAYFNRKYYLDYKKKQYEKHFAYLNNEYEQIEYKSKQLQQYHRQLENEMEKMKLNFNIMIRCKRGQDEVTDDKFITPKEMELRLETSPNNEILQEMNLEEQQELANQEPSDKYTLGVPLDNCLLVDCTDIDSKNEKLQSKFNEKIDKQNLNKKQMQEKLYLTLENSLLQVSTSDIELKMKYLKLTRVTKKIQEIVTGKEEINQMQIAKLYEDKKKNLEENTNKRLEALENKHKEIASDIEKKTVENTQFAIKLEKLKEDVGKTKQILDLGQKVDENVDEEGYEEEHAVPDNKTFEIAEVSKLKSQVKNYYEEIEYLRAELDKLRARTFPSFLQKPDNVIYPDEK